MAQAKAATADNIKFTPEATGALGPPGFALLMEPVVTEPAEQELDDTTTENVFDAAFSVVLNVTPLRIKVCAPAAVVGPVYVKVVKPTPNPETNTVPQVPRVPVNG